MLLAGVVGIPVIQIAKLAAMLLLFGLTVQTGRQFGGSRMGGRHGRCRCNPAPGLRLRRDGG